MTMKTNGRGKIYSSITETIGEMHRAGIIHRDLKPNNILVEQGAQPAVKVIDFGVARDISSQGEGGKAPVIFGTPAYMSPEQLAGEHIDGQSDVYGLGAVLYALLTTTAPFTAGQFRSLPIDAARAIISNQGPEPAQRRAASLKLPWAAALTGRLGAILRKAMAVRKTDRYANPGQLHDALHAYLITMGADGSETGEPLE